MAQFSYEAYLAQQADKPTQTGVNGNGVDVHFMNEFLKNDGDVAIVRFPYHSMKDITFESTHSVKFPDKKWNSRVRCEGANCPLCKQGIKVDIRFFVKALVYVVDAASNELKILNTVWDRPSAFADIDIKNLMTEYGDIANYLFKIKRNGQGLNTRYTINIITNTAVYNPEIYKTDFTQLDTVDASKLLSKSYQQYVDAFNPNPKPAVAPATQNYQQPQAAPAQPTQPAYTAPQPAQPVYTAHQQPVVQPQPQVETPSTPTSTPVDTNPQEARAPRRYQF